MFELNGWTVAILVISLVVGALILATGRRNKRDFWFPAFGILIAIIWEVYLRSLGR